MTRKVLILGGARFHGLLLAERLSNMGDNVYVLNRGNYREQYSFKVTRLIADRNNCNQIKQVLDSHCFDFVVDNNAYTPKHISTIVDLICNKCDQYIFVSSAAVYRKLSSQHKLREEDAVQNLENLFSPKVEEYARNKFLAEKELIKNLNRLNFTIIRFPNIFGEGDFLGKLYYFYTRFMDRKKIMLEQEVDRFSLIYVQDVVKVLETALGNTKCLGYIINVADPNTYNYHEFFSTIYGELYSDDKVGFAPAKELWKDGYFLPFPWGPVLDTTLSEQLLGNSYTPLKVWGDRTLKWEIEYFKERV